MSRPPERRAISPPWGHRRRSGNLVQHDEEVRKPVIAYAVSTAALVAAVFLRWLLDPVMGDSLPLVTLFGAVAAAAWVGRYRAALVVAVLGYLACDYLFIPPRGRLGLDDLGKVVGLLAYLVTCALIIGFGEAMRFAQVRAAERGELLRVTLASIGDAVITTDVDGRITYLNAVAESLTGWAARDALGQPLDAVFRVVNEQTRQPVESPATRALRDGIVVGLANHTVLMHKDGTEHPIDDSAAPIRDEQGHVSGCVLIFRDVTVQRRLEQEKTDQLLTARLLASIVESSDDAIISKSLDGVIQTWNASAERLFGTTAAGGRGSPHLPRHPPGPHRRGGPHRRLLESRAAYRPLRDGTIGVGWAAHPGLAHDLAHQGRRGHCHRCFQDRAGRHATVSGPRPSARSSSRWSRTAPTSSPCAT